MSRAGRLLAGVAALLLPGAMAVAETNGAIAVLLAQGAHWQGQDRPELALGAFERVLAADPSHAAALAGAAQAQAALGNQAAAQALLARLRQVTGSADPRAAEAEARVRGEAMDRDLLADARRLAEAGQGAEAVVRYREAFGGTNPPEALAAEFYQVLAGTEGGWEQAREALARMAARRPGDARLRLAWARVLTYRGETRAEGLELLRGLAGDATLGPAAAAAWRQALTWLGTGAGAVPELEAYATRFPEDDAMARRLAEARAAPTGGTAPGDAARLRGFEALGANRPRDAAREFEAALVADPRDADALGGLGVVRLREGRATEARDLLERAVAAAPERRAQWQRALDGAAYATELAEARAQLRAGQAETAEQALRQALQRDVPDRADAEALLGDILLRRGEAGDAEARYRAALARRPDFGAAAAGLERALRRQGRIAEADDLARRHRGAGRAATGPAAALRAQAATAADPAQAAALLRAALAAEPGNPWISLDLARLLARQGRAEEARALVEAARARGGAEAAHAAALFAEEQGRMADAAALIGTVPARSRNADMNRLLARARTAAEVAAAAEAARGPGGFEGRNRLLALAARPDPTGAVAAQVVRAFGTLRDPRGAEEAARVALAANRQFAPSARLGLAAALLEADRPDAAGALLGALDADGRLGAEERRQVAALRSGIAVRASDRLNEQGDQAAGFERLRPVLAGNPQDPAANLALARLYGGARQPAEAARVAEAVLARDPHNIEARAALVDAAIAGRDIRRAEGLAAEGRALAPREPRALVLEARVARAAGDARRAQRALEAAAEQRRAQTGQDRANPFAAPPGNPFASPGGGNGTAAAPEDSVSAEIAREMAALREETSPRLRAAPGIRVRSGSGGLDRLDEISGQVEVSAVPGALGGRLALRATPVAIASGDLSADPASQRRFGTNFLAASSGGAAPDSTAAGLGLGLEWRRGTLALDIGTTPLGFRTTNLVGGAEVAPLISGRLRLRLTGERRAVTDSLLAWSGQHDPLSGRSWGGVVRTGGRAQLEYSAGPATLYAGGGYAVFTGDGVADNARVEAGAGLSYAVLRRPEEEVTAGLDLVYFGHDRNLRHFTLGHGGYFSPQSYAALNLPVDWRRRSGDLSWRLGGTVGFASWREKAAPLFPSDPGLQAQAAAVAAGDATLSATYPGQTRTGFTGGARADLEYALGPQLRIGTSLRYDRAADWSEALGLLYLRYRHDR